MKAPQENFDFPKMEETLLAFWEENQTFAKQNDQRKESPHYSFYDGPPFANGLPHYGHILATTIKDTVCRYWIMKGYQMDRRFGWDCHGLPVEFEIEKREGLKGRPDILKIGMESFNKLCQDSVLFYTKEWQKTITRLGRWVDWDRQYRTMDPDYMESVWWVFSELFKKDLIYRGFKVVPYSPRTSSVVSNFEANQNYKNTQDPSLTLKFRSTKDGSYFLVWTTTPWTLPANLALAVGGDVDYAKVQVADEVWVMAQDLIESVLGKNPPEHKILSVLKGHELAGETYEPLFDFFSDHPRGFQVLLADFVDTKTGTGIVHQAPAYGEDDFLACQKAQISLVDPIDENGCFTHLAGPYQGLFFKDADKVVIRDLKARNLVVRHETLVHSYPFDERTDTPLMYKAVPSWYVAVEQFKDQLAANNKTIRWVPGHLRDGRMGTWLENARDWAISRNRFWGTPLPVWICTDSDDHREVFASRKSLEDRAQTKVPDLHLHHIEKIQFPCQTCSGTMKSVGLVFDCWFESGSMPYAQNHYPFEGKDRFVFPADFVGEGLDQTRGWFYTLNVLSTGLFDKPAFKNVIVNGVILDEEGKKMSKRHRNYTPPDDLVAKYGADSVRLYLLGSPLLRGEDLIFQDQGVKDIARALLLPLWNAYSFLATYGNSEGWTPTPELAQGVISREDKDQLDLWILSRLEGLSQSVAAHMEEYRLYLIVDQLVTFMDDLTNWYIRLSRRRFWSDDRASYETLFYVLLEFSKILAPFAPFFAEFLYGNLLDQPGVSVHLADLPRLKAGFADPALEEEMELLRTTVNLGRSLRQQHKIKIRQVLPELIVITHREKDRRTIEQGRELLRQELNIRNIRFTTEESDYLHLSLKPNLKTLGARLGKDLKVIIQALGGASPQEVSRILSSLKTDGQVLIQDIPLTEGDFLIERKQKDTRLIATDQAVTVLLDPSLTPELIREGQAREVVNRIQNLRKDSGLQVSDRIDLEIVAPQGLCEALEEHREYLLQEVLGVGLKLMPGGGACSLKFMDSYAIDGASCVIALEVFQKPLE
jgi:isoleucyl-tRNA synthetase